MKLTNVTTGIGAVPFAEAARAVEFVLGAGLDIPFWPQLPKRDLRERMIPQYSERLPGFTVLPGENKVFCDLSIGREEALTELVGGLLQVSEPPTPQESAPFGPSEKFAAGYHAFLAALAGKPRLAMVKGQVTGPFTLLLGLNNQLGTPVYHDTDLRDAALMLLEVQLADQVHRLKEVADDVLVFIDEPVLGAFGTSAYLFLSDDEVTATLDKLCRVPHQLGALVGGHCCGNTDWGMIARSAVDVISFDAWGYGETIARYADDIGAFLSRGGYLAWGIVPTTEDIDSATLEDCLARLEGGVALLTTKGIDQALVREQALFTPSCGAGSVSEPQTERVFELLRDLKAAGSGT